MVGRIRVAPFCASFALEIDLCIQHKVLNCFYNSFYTSSLYVLHCYFRFEYVVRVLRELTSFWVFFFKIFFFAVIPFFICLKKEKKERKEKKEEAFLCSDQFMLSVKVKEIKGAKVVLQMESRVVVESIVVFLLRKS
jgi:cbb3-type cytochrome oxidase subunit 3